MQEDLEGLSRDQMNGTEAKRRPEVERPVGLVGLSFI